jgi:hypothetical protein
MYFSEHLVSRTNLSRWFKAGDGAANNLMPDYSGNAANAVSSSTNAPVLTDNVRNGVSGWHWDGSTSIPLVSPGPVLLKHWFVVLSAEDAAFSVNRGVLSDSSATTLLASDAAGTTFFDSTSIGADFTYRKNNRLFLMSDAEAPMSGSWGVIEQTSPAGAGLFETQIGQQIALTARRWKGYIAEILLYTGILSEPDRTRLYQYFARKYHNWEETQDGNFYYFPFVSDWGLKDPRKKVVLYDEAEDGTPIYRTKRAKRRESEMEFTKRTQDELAAAEAFYDEHHPGRRFVYRDKTVTPNIDITYRFHPDAVVDAIPSGPNNFSYALKLNQHTTSPVVEVIDGELPGGTIDGGEII